jgi:hypothetical protein
MDNNLKKINRYQTIYGKPQSSHWQTLDFGKVTTDWTLVSVLLLTSLEFLRNYQYQAECEWTRLAAQRLWSSEREVSMTMEWILPEDYHPPGNTR